MNKPPITLPRIAIVGQTSGRDPNIATQRKCFAHSIRLEDAAELDRAALYETVQLEGHAVAQLRYPASTDDLLSD
ncbi:MAG: hypothetical protein JSR78_02155 [Proteobacteria bacterium]|nr:hypothetical protein [Pseudomonadota bacterium]